MITASGFALSSISRTPEKHGTSSFSFSAGSATAASSASGSLRILSMCRRPNCPAPATAMRMRLLLAERRQRLRHHLLAVLHFDEKGFAVDVPFVVKAEVHQQARHLFRAEAG